MLRPPEGVTRDPHRSGPSRHRHRSPLCRCCNRDRPGRSRGRCPALSSDRDRMVLGCSARFPPHQPRRYPVPDVLPDRNRRPARSRCHVLQAPRADRSAAAALGFHAVGTRCGGATPRRDDGGGRRPRPAGHISVIPRTSGCRQRVPLVPVGSVVQYVSRQNSPRSYVVDRKRLSVPAWGLLRPGRSPPVVNSVTPPGAPAAARTARSPRCRPPETETRRPRSQARNQLTSRGGTGPSGAPSLQRTPMSGPDRETPNPRLVWIVESGLRCGDVLGLRGAHERGGR